MDGVQARISKMANFNNGNLSYELLIRSNTIILDLGKYEPSQTFKEAIPLKLNEIFNTSERVCELLCYIYIYVLIYICKIINLMLIIKSITFIIETINYFKLKR